MTETSESNSRRVRRKHDRRHIPLPDGDELMPRDEFAEVELGVCSRTVQRMKLGTTYIAGIAYVARNHSLRTVVERMQRRTEEPPRHRRGSRAAASPKRSR